MLRSVYGLGSVDTNTLHILQDVLWHIQPEACGYLIPGWSIKVNHIEDGPISIKAPLVEI